MFAAFVFNGTVHEWGHEYANRGRACSFIRGWNSRMVGVGTPSRPPPNATRVVGMRTGIRGSDLGEGNE